jgi:hypothetical protein
MSSATGDSVDGVDGGVVGQDVGWSKFVTRLSPGVGPACCVDAFGGDGRRGSPGCMARKPVDGFGSPEGQREDRPQYH